MKISLSGMLALAVTTAALAACNEEQSNRMVGTLERDRIELKVESNEPILAIMAVDGQPIQQGDLVLEQDPSRRIARLAQLEAQREQLQARLAELQRGPREELIREAGARLQGSVAMTISARQEFERAAALFEKGVGQQSSVDRSKALLDEAMAGEAANRENLERLLNGTTVEEIQQAMAAVTASEAAVRVAQQDLEHLAIRAPVSGTLDRVWYETGERPQPGATVAVILDSARPYARVYVPASLRTRVQAGDQLQVSIEGVQETLQGTVSWVSSDASFTPYFALTEYDRSRLSYLAEIELPGASGLPSGVPLEAWPAD